MSFLLMRTGILVSVGVVGDDAVVMNKRGAVTVSVDGGSAV